ncbi:MAG: hypothetical protein AB8G05_04290 [Oligoflexales bacterium]
MTRYNEPRKPVKSRSDQEQDQNKKPLPLKRPPLLNYLQQLADQIDADVEKIMGKT